MAHQTKQHIEAQGFFDHRIYDDFIKDKYSDVSVSLLRKDFENIKNTMRELIDNTYPYHNHSFSIPIKKIDGDFIKEKNFSEYYKNLEYHEYYEHIIDQYYKVLELEQKSVLTPDEKNMISEIRDYFVKESRRLRRTIMKDLSVSGIIHKAEIKTEREVNKLLKGE